MKRIIKWVNNNLKHVRDKAGDYGIRVVMHIGIGILMSIPVFSWGLIALFIYYQKNEDKWTHDQSWKDVAGAIVGYIIGELILIGFIVWYLI